jgi:hypothetical protein
MDLAVNTERDSSRGPGSVPMTATNKEIWQYDSDLKTGLGPMYEMTLMSHTSRNTHSSCGIWWFSLSA